MHCTLLLYVSWHSFNLDWGYVDRPIQMQRNKFFFFFFFFFYHLQVCRLAYELMQTHHVDASRNFFSLDDIYYFGGQQAHDVKALQRHQSTSSFSFEKGDLLGIAGNEKNGQSVGVHRKTSTRGNFPSYKVEEEVILADFPTYLDVA